MKKSILLTNLVSALLVLVVSQVHGFEPFDFESEFPLDFDASKFSSESQYFPQTNSEEPSLLSQSEFPQDFEASKFSSEPQYFPQSNPEESSLLSQSELPQDFKETQFSESERPYDSLEILNFPEKTSRFSDNEFPKEFEYPEESFEYGTDARHKIKSPPPSPAPSPSETPSPSPSPPPLVPENTCVHKCSLKCRKEFFPPLHNLCLQVCKKKCLLRYSVLIYRCTSRCAESMPKTFKSGNQHSFVLDS
ncbi:hypothetical protein F3Y22_tig00110257pilonHSYRG00079 [Hibiscus syriacus]|uniref:Uncharacterized protein n=1 Tax=Hibiscus syriacus TaxID=106335 RepID=A0A6A3BB91_HIBSY|nr:hypothetical protein F3Y22_tig00110257pilonHSYRG00079 [Hibiscus syriacus]